MTVGEPIGLILGFAVPLLIGNLFQQFYNMVDTAVVGYHLGDSAIAAIGAVSSLYTLLINFANGLNTGYGIVVTQRFGAHDAKGMKQAIAGMLVLDLAVSATLTALALTFLHPLMRFLNVPEEIFTLSDSYIRVICCGIVTTVGYNMFAAILRAVGNSRTPLYFLILSSLLNIGLDVLFVMGLDMGIGGAAVATVIAQGVSAVGCGVYVLRHYRDMLPGKQEFQLPASMLRELITAGLSVAMMNGVVELGSVFFSRANNLLGETYIAAYAAGRKLLIMMIQPQATIAVANSTFVGQNWGARKFERIQTTLNKVFLMELGWGVIATTIIYCFGGPLVRLTTGTGDPEVVGSAVLSLRIHFAAFPFLGVLFALRNALQSMGRKLIPVISSCIELLMKILAAFVLIPRLGFLGSCITEPVTWILMVSFLYFYYRTQKRSLFEDS